MARHNVVLLSRDPGQMFGYTVVPLLMMIALRPIYLSHGDATAGTLQATVGPMVLFSLITLNVIGHSMLNERTWHTWNRVRATPASSAELLLGKCVPFYLMLIVQQAIILMCSRFAFGLRIAGIGALTATLIMMLAWSGAVLALGALLSTVVRSHGQLNTITDVGAFLVTVVGGGLTPTAAMPSWMRLIAPYSPGYWAIDGYRGAITGQHLAALVHPVGILVVIMAVAGAAAVIAATGRSTRDMP
jgi:ABC-2 type transport system permease protein